MSVSQRTCRHCGTENYVARCDNCERPFALTTAHIEGRLRAYDDGPASVLPSDFRIELCDFCAAKAAGHGSAEAVSAGVRQRTCPACHTEFFADG
jgi:hypothetical protein